MAYSNQRLFVGNLPLKISDLDVRKKLSMFGDVQSVEMKQRSDCEGNILSSFAFVDIAVNENDLERCFKYFGKEQWHKHRVKVQLAKESFLDRLKRERKSNNLIESPMKTSPKDSPVGVLGGSKTTKSVALHGCSGHEETTCPSKDDTPLKKKSSRIRGEDVPSPVQLCSSKSGSGFSSDGPVLDEISDEYAGSGSRGKGLPMFGGSRTIIDINEVNDKCNGIEAQKTGKRSAKSPKPSTPNDKNNLSKRGVTIVNTSEDFGESCSLKDVPKKKNLAMFCGTKALLGEDKSPERLNSSSARFEVKKSEVRLSSGPLGLNGNHLREDAVSSRLNVQNNVDQDTRSGLGGERLMEDSEVISMPSSSKVKKLNSPVGKKSKTNVSMAERKRLNALEERKKAFALRKEVVKKALSSIDLKNRTNSKIIFDDDEDDEVPNEEKVGNAHSDKAKPKLFAEESDDEDIKNLESAEFKIKPQFEGRQGQKLLEIQSRYGHDRRFNLDERFLESDEEDINTEEQQSAVKEDLNAEKDHQLSILKDMFGVSISERPRKRDKKEKMDSLSMVRFDPTNPEHSKYLVKEEELKEMTEKKGGEKKSKKMEGSEENPPKKAKVDEEMQEDPVPIVSERFYKISDKLKESLKLRTANLRGDEEGSKQEGSSGGFSLLQKFGSAPSDNEEEEEVEYFTKNITRSCNEWEKNPFRYDSSDEEEVEAAEQSKEEIEKVDSVKAEEPSKTIKSAVETFYFQENDPRFQEGLDFFGIKKTFSEMQEGFDERRADLKLIIKAKVRNNKRKSRPVKKKLGGARNYKKKMAAYGVKR